MKTKLNEIYLTRSFDEVYITKDFLPIICCKVLYKLFPSTIRSRNVRLSFQTSAFKGSKLVKFKRFEGVRSPMVEVAKETYKTYMPVIWSLNQYYGDDISQLYFKFEPV